MGFFKKFKEAWLASMTFDRLDDDFYEELEEALILADIGAATAADTVAQLRKRVSQKLLGRADEVKDALRDILAEKLDVGDPSMDLSTQPSVVLIIGVNGVGKTTSIGKLAARYKSEGKKVLLCAGDTFRAAAADQLEIWADRAGVDIVRQHEGADPGAVLFDALQAAKARNVDVVLCDTAGRLHNKDNLMKELAKLRKIIDAAGAGRHHRPERPYPGPSVQGDGGAYRHHPDEAGWYRQGRHRGGHCPGAAGTGEVRGRWRGHRRPAALRRQGIHPRAAVRRAR